MPSIAYRPYILTTTIFSTRSRSRAEMAISLFLGALFSVALCS
jgi:hypothetical protein